MSPVQPNHVYNIQSIKYSSGSTASSVSSPSSPVSPNQSLSHVQMSSSFHLTSPIMSTQHSLPLTPKQPYMPDQSFNHSPEHSLLTNVNNSLLNDGSYKYVQEWLVANRFSHLLNLFTNYTSNDILRLSKEDMVNLCGGPDGIRCFNMAHNIQIRPKLTIFVTFQTQGFFSAVYMPDWKSGILTRKLLDLYIAFIANLDEESEAGEHLNKIEESDSIMGCQYTKLAGRQQEALLGPNYEYELFLKLKGFLVKASDELLNNLDDQSKYLVELELCGSMLDSGKSPTNKKRFFKIIMYPID